MFDPLSDLGKRNCFTERREGWQAAETLNLRASL
jgi:hypothetical protein